MYTENARKWNVLTAMKNGAILGAPIAFVIQSLNDRLAFSTADDVFRLVGFAIGGAIAFSAIFAITAIIRNSFVR